MSRPASLHPHKAVLARVGPADGVPAADAVQSLNNLDGTQARAVDRNRHAPLEADLHLRARFRGFLRAARQLPDIVRDRAGRVFERATLMAQVPDVLVAAVDFRQARRDGYIVLA